MFINKIKKMLKVFPNTDNWMKVRYNMITATDVPSVLESNPNLRKYNLLQNKCSNLSMKNDSYNIFYNRFTDVALNLYGDITNKKLNKIGYINHDKINWLGANSLAVTEDNKLVDVRCAINRKLRVNEPFSYWIKIQIQLEVLNLNSCELFQCQFFQYKSKKEMLNDKKKCKFSGENKDKNGKKFYWKLVKINQKTIERDTKWFRKNLPILIQFYKDIIYYRKNGLPRERRKRSNSEDSTNLNSISMRTRLSRSREYIDYNWSEWVSATETKNYILNDPLLDWYNKYAVLNNIKQDNVKDKKYNFDEYIMGKGVEFENAILMNLETRFGPSLVKVANNYEGCSLDKLRETISLMEKGTPIISSGILHNFSNKTYGIPDLIVRSDYLNKLVECKVLNEDEIVKGCKFNNQWHYCVIDIKFTSLTLGKGEIVRKVGNIDAYKSQTIIYNKALGKLQEYLPDECYLMGRRIKEGNNKFGGFYKLGKIDMKNKKFIERVDKSIEWIKDLKKDGFNWKPGVTKKRELLPNMNNKKDYPWHNAKKELALKMNELTMLWSVSVNDRNTLNDLGIYKISDIFCSSNMFKKNKRISNIIDKIVSINKNCDGNFVPEKHDLKELKLDKKDYVKEFYVDFETTNNINENFANIVNYKEGDNLEIIGNSADQIIYMIGVGWIEYGEWKFNNYIVDRISLYHENLIIKKFLDFVSKYPKKRLYHWSKAEPLIMGKKISEDENNGLNWFDLLDVFRKVPVNIKGNYSFGLKNVAKSMFKHKMIETEWENGEINGLDAMLVSIYAENKCRDLEIYSIKDYEDMEEIVKYNEIDCKVMWDILRFLRLKWKN